MAIELTREELFNQVWERPMTKVAAEYNISDVALKKICDKHRIPVPGLGYWAKKVAGQKVAQAHFRAVADPAINRIVIHGSPLQKLSEPVRAAREVAKKREKMPENKVEVVPVPGDLHPWVERTKGRLEKAQPSGNGVVTVAEPDLFNLEIAPASVGRVTAFLNALVLAAENRGYQAVKGNKTTVFLVDDETLEFRVAEEIGRSKHVPTEAELVAIEKWEKKQQRRLHSWSSGDWTPRPTPPEWDYAPTGRLQVLINEGQYGCDGIRKKFADGKTQRIETLINPILEALATWAAAIKAKRIEDERRRLAWEEEERRRKECQRNHVLEKKRVEALAKYIDFRQQQQQVLEFVAAVEAKLNAGDCKDPDAVREWIAWAKDYANRLDPLRDGLPRLLQFQDFKSWELG